jgi:sterol desaturase/sphingolipid hydroxylase (fatty acid hydroxylase superfamily)
VTSADLLLGLKSLVVLGAVALFVPWERLRPAAASPLLLTLSNRSRAALHRLLRNLGLFAVNLLLSPLVVVPLTVLADRWSLGWRPPALDSAWAIPLDLLLLDLWIYWWHRANHEIPFLWRFHVVHHLDEWLDSSSAVRFHFGEVLLSALVRAAVIVLLDIQLASVLLFEGLVLAAAIFHHSDAALPPKLEAALSKVLVTPSIHWIHHHAKRRDTDSNYATVLSIWDPLFGTRSPTRRTPDLRIGVERCRDRPLPRLLAVPLDGRLCREGDGPAVQPVQDRAAGGEEGEQRRPQARIAAQRDE